MLLRLALLVVFLSGPTPVDAATYYVDSNAGSDAADGLSAETAWRGLERVNQARFAPGDRILFRGGRTWQGRLVPPSSGTAEAPITFSGYGEGLPRLLAEGAHEAILVAGVEFVTLSKLQIENPGDTYRRVARGITIMPQTPGAMRGIRLLGNVITNVRGGPILPERALSGAIYIDSADAEGYLEDLLIEGNRIADCSSRGLGGNQAAPNWNRPDTLHRRVTIRGNHIERVGADGIRMTLMRDVVCEDNTVLYAGSFTDGAPQGFIAAVFPQQCTDVLIQRNHIGYTVHGVPEANHSEGATEDSQAFDVDWGCGGSIVFQHNFTHDNHGGFFLFMGKPVGAYEEKVGPLREIIVRHNISQNDGIRRGATDRQGRREANRLFEIHGFGGRSFPLRIEHNVFYSTDEIGFETRALSADFQGLRIVGNIFQAPEASYPSTLEFHGNHYAGHAAPAVDAGVNTRAPRFTAPGTAKDVVTARVAYTCTGCGRRGFDSHAAACPAPSAESPGASPPPSSAPLRNVASSFKSTADDRGHATFSARQRFILDGTAAMQPRGDLTRQVKSAIYIAMARFGTGDIDGGHALANWLLDQPLHDAMFVTMAGMDLLHRFEHDVRPELRQKIRDYVTRQQDFTGGSTENHRLMFAVSGYLAAQTWTDWSRAKEVETVTRTHVLNKCAWITRFGVLEHDSPTYQVFHFNSLLSLHDHAKDPVVEAAARTALEVYLADWASEWLHGVWVASTLRSFGQNMDHDGLSSATGYLYFGSDAPDLGDGCAAMNALSAFRPPEAVLKLITDRTVPYVYRSSEDQIPRGTPGRFSSMLNPPNGFRKTTFMHREYGVFSQYDGNGLLGWHAQLLRWSVVWRGGHFFLRHPVNRDIGDSPGNQVLQHRGVVIGVSREPMTLVVRGVRTQTERDGWTFLSGGPVLIAFRQYDNGRGWIVETAPTEDYASLDAFADRVLRETAIDASHLVDREPRLLYRALDGAQLDLQYDGRGGKGTDRQKINGVAVDYNAWPRMESPWVKASVGGDQLVIRHGASEHVVRFPVAPSSAAETQPASKPQPTAETYDARKTAMIAAVKDLAPEGDATRQAKMGVYIAMARYAAGDIAGGNEMTERVFTTPGRASMFLVMAGMDLVCRYGRVMPPGLVEKAQKFVTQHSDFLGGSTENHHLMFAAGGYLAAQTWPDWPKAAEVKKVTRDFLIWRCQTLVRYGMLEFDSPTYQPFHLNPLISIYDHTTDLELKAQVQAALNVTFADMASEWLDGVWVASTLRSYTQNLDHDAEAAGVGYVAFGSDWPRLVDGTAVMLSVSSYTLPKLVQELATDRDRPFLYLSSEDQIPPGTPGRHATMLNPPNGFRKTSYLEHHYGLYSHYDGNGVLGWHDQLLRWGVAWKGGHFLLRQPKQGDVGDRPTNQVLQHGRALIGVSTEPMKRFEHGIVARYAQDGWEFLSGGPVFVAFRELGGGRGWIVETAPADEYESLQAYADHLVPNSAVVEMELDQAEPRLVYRTAAFDTLDLQFDGRGGKGTDRRRINGVAVDYTRWPRLQSPRLSAEVGSPRVVVSNRQRTAHAELAAVLSEAP